jgi:DNA polymerase
MKQSRSQGDADARHAEEGTPADCEATGSAAPFLPKRLTLPLLAAAAKSCRGCTLYCHATQVVFGAGPTDAPLMLIGEQPGDQEDRQGEPFVGPAGRLLDEALEQASISRSSVYVTNAVKHFKWTRRGKRRLHAKPSSREIAACRPWLEAEIQVVHPRLIVFLGASAAQSLLGSKFRLTRHRGEFMDGKPWSSQMLATVHPSLLLRIPDREARQQARLEFFDDFKTIAQLLPELTDKAH